MTVSKEDVLNFVNNEIEDGYSDATIVEQLEMRFPNRDHAEIVQFVKEAREIFQISHTVKGHNRPITAEQLGRLGDYYKTFSKLNLVAKERDGYVYLVGTELAVLRLFARLYLTLEYPSVGQEDGYFYFRFRS